MVQNKTLKKLVRQYERETDDHRALRLVLRIIPQLMREDEEYSGRELLCDLVNLSGSQTSLLHFRRRSQFRKESDEVIRDLRDRLRRLWGRPLEALAAIREYAETFPSPDNPEDYFHPLVNLNLGVFVLVRKDLLGHDARALNSHGIMKGCKNPRCPRPLFVARTSGQVTCGRHACRRFRHAANSRASYHDHPKATVH